MNFSASTCYLLYVANATHRELEPRGYTVSIRIRKMATIGKVSGKFCVQVFGKKTLISLKMLFLSTGNVQSVESEERHWTI